MPEVVGVFDGGFEKLFFNGQTINAGVIVFRTQHNESEPVDHVGYCAPHLRDSIIKYLKKIQWQPKIPVTLNPEILSELNIYIYPADDASRDNAGGFICDGCNGEIKDDEEMVIGEDCNLHKKCADGIEEES